MKWVENGAADSIFTCSDDKPIIFLIGDSIRRGYCHTVKDELADAANVFFVDDNCRSTQYVIFCMKRWAALFDHPEKVDVVQFNCGHWDVAHWHGYKTCLTSESEYAKNIQMIIDSFRSWVIISAAMHITSGRTILYVLALAATSSLPFC